MDIPPALPCADLPLWWGKWVEGWHSIYFLSAKDGWHNEFCTLYIISSHLTDIIRSYPTKEKPPYDMIVPLPCFRIDTLFRDSVLVSLSTFAVFTYLLLNDFSLALFCGVHNQRIFLLILPPELWISLALPELPGDSWHLLYLMFSLPDLPLHVHRFKTSRQLFNICFDDGVHRIAVSKV